MPAFAAQWGVRLGSSNASQLTRIFCLLAPVGIFGTLIDVGRAYSCNAEGYQAKPYSKLLLALKSTVYALPAAVSLATAIYQWDEKEYLSQILNAYVFVAAMLLTVPPLARAQYLQQIRLVDAQLSKVVYQLKQCLPLSWRQSELSSERSCTDSCLSWWRSNRNERSSLDERNSLLGAEPSEREERAQRVPQW